MEISEQEKEVLKATFTQLWAKGCHSPQEGNIATAFTNLVQRILTQKPDAPAELKKV
jgi:hypothetical protein